MENLVSFDSLRSFYSNKKVFITGHTGFKGAWLMAILHSLGANIKGYALQPIYQHGLFDFLQPFVITENIIADIRDKNRLQQELESFQPDIVFHLAAQPLVRASYQLPAETFEVNVAGTANLLEGIHRLKGRCTIVVITTDKVYENKEQAIFYKEEDRLGGYDPYSASKACTELVVHSFRSSFFNWENFATHQKSIASVRAGNVIGGGDWSKDRIIPDVIRALEENEAIQVRNPAAVRPWQHVLEPLGGYLLLGKMLTVDPQHYSKAYNFGPLSNDHLTVKEIVETAIKIWGRGTWKDISDPEQPHEAHLLQLDISRAEKELQWHPKLNAYDAVKWTINWYKQPSEAKADYTFGQIKDYFSL